MHRSGKNLTPLLTLVGILVATCAWIGWHWSPMDPSDQELLANYAKAMDFIRGVESVKGWPWWTPHFNLGHSMSNYLGTIITYLWMLLGAVLFQGAYGAKFIGLAFILLSGVAMYAYVREISGNPWSALISGLLYALSPQMFLRLGLNEHMVVVFCFVYPPLIFWALRRMAQEVQLRYSLLLGVAYAAMTLTYVRSAAVFLPAMILYTLWLFLTIPGSLWRISRGAITSLLSFFVLAVVPLLPFMRESEGYAWFIPQALAGWSRTFSLKSLLSWLDWNGLALSGAPPFLTVEQGGFFLGTVAVITLLLLFFHARHREEWLTSPEGIQARFFLGLVLFLTWLSLGPRNLLLGHLEFLRSAQLIPHLSIPIAWLILIASVPVIYLILPRVPYRKVWAWIASVTFLLVPGFVLIQQIPFYTEIRAPRFFWEIGGTLAICTATGLILPRILTTLFRQNSLRITASILLLALALIESLAYSKHFRLRELPPHTYSNFIRTESFLAEQSKPGHVDFVSGRYFYLLTPELSDRSLLREAFHQHFAQHGLYYFNILAPEHTDIFPLKLGLMGVRYIVLDKLDPDFPPAHQKRYREAFEIAYENDHFTVLENPRCLAPAYTASDYIAVLAESPANVSDLLDMASFQFLPVSLDHVEVDTPNLAGFGGGARPFEIRKEFNIKQGTPFKNQGLKVTRPSYHTIRVSGIPPGAHWLVIPEAFHRDWIATEDSNQYRLPVTQSFNSLLTVNLGNTPPESLTLRFTPPNWYTYAIATSGLGWFFCLSLLGALYLSPLEEESTPSSKPSTSRTGRPLAIIPTYNEAENIRTITERVLKQDSRLHLLVVDDASPDGTQKLVEAMPESGKRIHLLKRPGKLGLGTAYCDGMKWGLSKDYTTFLHIDADLSHNPDDIPRLLEKITEGYDLAIGSRYKNGFRVRNWPLHRILISTCAGIYVRFVTGLRVWDPTSGFNAIHASAVKKLPWEKLNAGGYSFLVQEKFHLIRSGARWCEVPITFTDRLEGSSKMSLSIALEAIHRVFSLGIERFTHSG